MHKYVALILQLTDKPSKFSKALIFPIISSFCWQKLVLKVSIMAQLIKKYIYLLGTKLNNPLHIDYISNVFKFTKISAKWTQESLKWYEQAQKHQRRPNIKTSKIFTAPYTCNNSRMALLHYFHFFYNLQKLLSLLSIIFPLLKFLLQI